MSITYKVGGPRVWNSLPVLWGTQRSVPTVSDVY